LIAAIVSTWLVASPASAEGEATFVIGGLVGGDFVEILQGDFSLTSTFENGTLYGGRLGYYGFPLGIEGSFIYSRSGLSVNVADIALDARVGYGEVNALLLILPGPVQPFVTAGGGVHYFKFTEFDDAQAAKFGWNFGGGLKASISRLALRVDLRNHRTTFTAGDFGIDDEITDALEIRDVSLNNIEVSFGIGIRF
jgi:opacity protein-like surface antigen